MPDRYTNAQGNRYADTSVAAAAALAVKLGHLQTPALETVGGVGSMGLTADQPAAQLEMGRLSIRSHMTELRRLDDIRDGDSRRLDMTRRHAIVWVAK